MSRRARTRRTEAADDHGRGPSLDPSADGLSDWFRVTKFGHLEHLHFGVPLAPLDPEPLDCIVIGYLIHRWQYNIDRAFIL